MEKWDDEYSELEKEYELERQLEDEEMEYKECLDKYLDAYGEYLQADNNLTRRVLERRQIEMIYIDPNFTEMFID